MAVGRASWSSSSSAASRPERREFSPALFFFRLAAGFFSRSDFRFPFVVFSLFACLVRRGKFGPAFVFFGFLASIGCARLVGFLPVVQGFLSSKFGRSKFGRSELGLLPCLLGGGPLGRALFRFGLYPERLCRGQLCLARSLVGLCSRLYRGGSAVWLCFADDSRALTVGRRGALLG